MTIPWDGALCRQVTSFELGAHAEQAASGAVVARADYYAGAWDDAVLHADRAITVSIESEFALSHPLAFFAAALVSAARGDRQTAATRLDLADELEASGTRDLSSAMAGISPESSTRPAEVVVSVRGRQSPRRRRLVVRRAAHVRIVVGRLGAVVD